MKKQFDKLAVALLATAVTLAAVPALGLEAAKDLKWAELAPPAPPKPKSFLAGRPADALPPPVEGGPEGRWLSGPAQRSQSAPEVVQALNGQRVRIGGYIVPLDFAATQVKEFLLVPFVGACIHVPPPPANQIVYVKSATGFDVKGTFDPVWVTGKLTTSFASTGLADAGYSLEAEVVEARKE